LVFILYFLFLLAWSIFDKNRRIIIFKIVLTFSLVFILSFSIFSDLFIQRFSSSSRLENISYTERINQYSFSKEIIKDNFFFGIGIGNYSNELYLLDDNKRKAWCYQPVHNVYLLSLAELGVFGFASFLVLLGYFIYQSLKHRLFFDFILLLSVLLIFLFDHWFWSLHFGIILFLYILASIHNDLKN